MRMDFSADSKVNQYDGYPKLVVEANDRARVAVLEQPLVVYKHSINKPVIDPTTGEIQQIEAKNGKGETYMKDHYEYVGSYVCTGDTVTVYNDPDSVDPENCLLCKAVTEHGTKFKAPKPYYLAHAIRYKLKQGSMAPAEPFQVDLVLWSLPAKNYNALVDIGIEFGDVRKVDLLLTECTSKNYQNYKIGAGSSAYWLATPERQATVMEIFKNNKADDATISKTAGKQQTPVAVKNDIDATLERWALHGKIGAANPMTQGEFGGQVMAGQAAAAQAETPGWDFSQQAPAAQAGVPDFLDKPAEAAQAPAATPPATADGGLPSFLGGAPEAAPAPAQPAAQAPADTAGAGQPGAASGEFSFDDLLNL